SLFATRGGAATALQGGQTAAPEGCRALSGPVQGVLLRLQAQPGDSVAAGQQIAVMEAMKMVVEATAHCAGVIRALQAGPGYNLFEGAPLAFIEPSATGEEQVTTEEQIDLAHIRADLQEVLDRQAQLTDAHRPEAVARRRKTGQRTARENL